MAKPTDDGPNADPPVANPPYIGTDLAARRARETGGGEGGGSGGEDLNARVGKLEVHIDYMRGDLAEIKGLLSGLAHLPTKQDLRNNLTAIITIGVAILAILVASMGWLETRAARIQGQAASPPAVQPIVIQLPSTIAPPPAAPRIK